MAPCLFLLSPSYVQPPWAGVDRCSSYLTFPQAPPSHNLPAHSDGLSDVAQIVALFIWILINIVAANDQRPAA